METTHYSSDFQDIINRPPNWLIKWGTFLIFLIFLFLFIISCFIEYPEVIHTEVYVTTETPSAQIIARMSGRINLFVSDKQAVKKGDHLGMIQNPAKINDVYYLNKIIDEFRFSFISIQNLFDIKIRENLELGDLQNSYLNFVNSVKEYQTFKNLDYYQVQITNFTNRIRQYEKLEYQYKKASQILNEEINIKKKIFKVDTLLYNEEVITELQMNESKSVLLQMERTYQTTVSNNINNQIAINQLRNQINELIIEEKRNEERLITQVKNSYEILDSELKKWKQEYLFQAPIDGEVAFVGYWNNVQYINSGEVAMFIVPNETNVLGILSLPIKGSGKVKLGQKVIVMTSNYPAEEFGVLSGKVQSISSIPENGNFKVIVSFPMGLTTSYGKHLDFQQSLEGTAEIITKDLSLMERVINNFKSILNN